MTPQTGNANLQDKRRSNFAIRIALVAALIFALFSFSTRQSNQPHSQRSVARLIKELQTRENQADRMMARAIQIAPDGWADHFPLNLYQPKRKEWLREKAAAELGNRSGGGVVQALVAALSDPSPEVRVAAAEALRRMGTEAISAIPELIRLTSSSDSRMSEAAFISLLAIGPDDGRVYQHFHSLFSGTLQSDSPNAAITMKQLMSGPSFAGLIVTRYPQAQPVDELLIYWQGFNAFQKTETLRMIQQYAYVVQYLPTDRLAKLIQTALREQSPSVINGAISLIPLLGGDAIQTFPTLTEYLETGPMEFEMHADQLPDRAMFLRYGLPFPASFKPPDVKHVFLQDFRMPIVKALEKLGSPAAPMVPTMKTLLLPLPDALGVQILRTNWHLTGEAEDAAKILKRWIEEAPDYDLVFQCLELLLQVEPDFKTAVSTLTRWKADPNVRPSLLADLIRLIGKRAALDPETVAVLKSFEDHPKHLVRLSVRKVLNDLAKDI